MKDLLEEILDLKNNCVRRQDYKRAASFRTLERKITKTLSDGEWQCLKSNYSNNTSKDNLDIYIFVI